MNQCAASDLRLPSISEAVTLATNHTVPGLPLSTSFWTDEELYIPTTFYAEDVTNTGGMRYGVLKVSPSMPTPTPPAPVVHDPVQQ